MPIVLVFTSSALPEELETTLLWREDVVRRLVSTVRDALAQSETTQPALVVVDAAHAEADQLIASLRGNPATRSLSIAVLARGDFDPDDLRFITAGANTILRLPADPEWDDRLAVLMSVAPRRVS